LFELAWKKQKTTIENDNYKGFNAIEIFDKKKKLIDGNKINPINLISIKRHVRK